MKCERCGAKLAHNSSTLCRPCQRKMADKALGNLEVAAFLVEDMPEQTVQRVAGFLTGRRKAQPEW